MLSGVGGSGHRIRLHVEVGSGGGMDCRWPIGG